MYRNIIEVSPMMNNDEYIFYTKKEVKYDETLIVSECKLVISRPVFECEGISRFNAKPVSAGNIKGQSELTYLLDAYYKIKLRIKSYQEIAKNNNKDFDINSFLSNYIGFSYYDCMSGGCPTYELSILRFIIDNYKVNMKTEVYPNEDKWYDFNDFMKDTKNVVDFSDIYHRLQHKLPKMNFFLPVKT